jgi:hypothetical protein
VQDSTVKFEGFRGRGAGEEPVAPPEAEGVPGMEATLRACPLIRGLGDAAVRVLARDCKMLAVRPATVLCAQVRPPPSLSPPIAALRSRRFFAASAAG